VRAVVYEREGAVGLTDVPDPMLIEPDDAIVRISRTAICRSDLHFVHGKAPSEPGDVLGPADATLRDDERVVRHVVDERQRRGQVGLEDGEVAVVDADEIGTDRDGSL